jgi:hypothetical protein
MVWKMEKFVGKSCQKTYKKQFLVEKSFEELFHPTCRRIELDGLVFFVILKPE